MTIKYIQHLLISFMIIIILMIKSKQFNLKTLKKTCFPVTGKTLHSQMISKYQ